MSRNIGHQSTFKSLIYFTSFCKNIMVTFMIVFFFSSRDTMIGQYSQGRLKMVDIQSFNKVLKTMWVIKYSDESNLANGNLFSTMILLFSKAIS